MEHQTTRTSALSARITSVLSASYADIEIRDALDTLDSRKIRNTAETRRNLRRDVQKEMIEANAAIIEDFGNVAGQLKSVGTALQNLQATIASIRRDVVFARTETKPMLDEANTLRSQRAQIETKQQILSAFNEHFLLGPDELKALTATGEPINDTFFAALVKAKRIHADSQHLLGGSSQRLGLEVLDQSTKNLTAAYQRLYRFLQREFKSLDLENPRITASVRRALRVLAERPSLFQNCLDTFAESRERTLSDAFYAALTGRNQYGGDRQKPIDFSAHEPLRYVGDMLAWAHSTAVSEREALEGLFVAEGGEIARGINEGLESDPWARLEATSESDTEDTTADTTKPEVFDGRRALSQLTNRSLAGVAQLLSQRIDTVVHSHDDPVLAYKIANLVVFYRNIFTRLVNQSGFLETLDGIETTALERFKTTLRYNINTLQREGDLSAPDDLSPPDFLPDALEALAALLKSYETSLTTAPSGPTDDDVATMPESLQLIYTEALDPYLSIIDEISRTLPPPSSTIFTLNSLHLILPTLSQFPHLTATKLADITTLCTAQIDNLTNNTHDFLLSTSGLAPLLAATSLPDPTTSPAFEENHLAAVSQQLDAFLPSAAMDAEARLGGVREKSVVGRVVREAGRMFVNDFERVEGVIMGIERGMVGVGDEEDEEEEGLRAVFPRTAEEVRVLLS